MDTFISIYTYGLLAFWPYLVAYCGGRGMGHRKLPALDRGMKGVSPAGEVYLSGVEIHIGQHAYLYIWYLSILPKEQRKLKDKSSVHVSNEMAHVTCHVSL